MDSITKSEYETSNSDDNMQSELCAVGKPVSSYLIEDKNKREVGIYFVL